MYNNKLFVAIVIFLLSLLTMVERNRCITKKNLRIYIKNNVKKH